MIVPTQKQQTEDMGLLPIVIRLQPVVDLSDSQLMEFCQVNRELRIERNARGELLIMLPAASGMGDRNAEITTQLRNWAKRDGSGKSFDSSAGFRLPNGAVRSPDASWLRLPRWNALTAEEKKQFAPLCPDFVVELRSESDRLRGLPEKMQEYLQRRRDGPVDRSPATTGPCLSPRSGGRGSDGPEAVSCDPVLSGFALDLREIW